MSTEVDAYFLKKSPNFLKKGKDVNRSGCLFFKEKSYFLKKGKDVNRSGSHHHKWCISTDYA